MPTALWKRCTITARRVTRRNRVKGALRAEGLWNICLMNWVQLRRQINRKEIIQRRQGYILALVI